VNASPAERARLEVDLAVGLAHVGEYEAAVERFGRAIEACAGAECPALHRVARDGIAELMVLGDRRDEAIALRRAVLAEVEAEVGAGSRAAARAKIGLAEALLRSSPSEALAMVDAAIPVLSTDDTTSMALSEANLIAAQAHASLGHGDESLAAARRAIALFEPRAKLGDRSVTAYRAALAGAIEAAGDIAGARREYDAILATEPEDVVLVAQVLLSRSYNRGLAGDHDGAIADARLARESLGTHAAQRDDIVVGSWSNEAWASFAKGDCDAGLVALDAAAKRSGESGDHERRALFELDAVGGLLDCGRVEQARRVLAATPVPDEGTRRAAWVTYYRARVEPDAVGAAALAQAREVAARQSDQSLVARLDALADGRSRGR
jgi:tetratricopeptide (TPR) repeat protein